MRIELKNKTLSLTFGYLRDFDDSPRKTFCDIFEVNDSTGVWNKLSTGKSSCDHRDAVNKAKGRKIALAKALSQLPRLTKDDRSYIWEVYFSKAKMV